MLVSLSVADSIGATASGICEGGCNWLTMETNMVEALRDDPNNGCGVLLATLLCEGWKSYKECL